MRFLSIFVIAVLALAVCEAAWADFEEITFETAGLTRTVSGTVNILKTTKLSVAKTQLLDQPSIEVMLELEVNGERLTLVPSDFDIKTIDYASKNNEKQTSIELVSHYWGYPITIYIDYWNNERNQYQEKSIIVNPSATPAGAIIKRITVESFRFADAVHPIAAWDSGFVNESKAAFAVVEPKSNRGLCWYFPSGTIAYVGKHLLDAYVEPNVPLAKGYKTGRLTLGAVTGKPESVFTSYRQMLLEARYSDLAKSAKLGSLKKRFKECFATCQYLPPCSVDGAVDAQGHIAGEKGFVMLFNSTDQVAKAVVPFSDRALGLSGELKLSDWTGSDKPSDLGTKKVDEKIEIEVPAKGYKIIGVNIDD